MTKPPDNSTDQLTDEERPTVRIPKYMSGDEVVSWSEVDAPALDVPDEIEGIPIRIAVGEITDTAG